MELFLATCFIGYTSRDKNNSSLFQVVCMATLTPTSSSAAIAGFGFYALVWGIAAKLDTIMALFGFHNSNYATRVRRWINKNKGLTLCITEVINFSIHGITNPAAVTFAIGGSICNAVFIFCLNPFLCWRDKKKNPLQRSTV